MADSRHGLTHMEKIAGAERMQAGRILKVYCGSAVHFLNPAGLQSIAPSIDNRGEQVRGVACYGGSQAGVVLALRRQRAGAPWAGAYGGQVHTGGSRGARASRASPHLVPQQPGGAGACSGGAAKQAGRQANRQAGRGSAAASAAAWQDCSGGREPQPACSGSNIFTTTRRVLPGSQMSGGGGGGGRQAAGAGRFQGLCCC